MLKVLDPDSGKDTRFACGERRTDQPAVYTTKTFQTNWLKEKKAILRKVERLGLGKAEG